MGIGSARVEAQATACDSPCKIVPLPLIGRPGAVCDSPCKLILLPLVSHSAGVSQASLPFVVVQVQESDMPVAPVSPPGDTVYFAYQVDKAAKEIPGMVAPHYPDSLEAVKLGGEVVAAFVVDTLGVADPNSLKILRSTHPLFSAAVRDVLPRLRYVPAVKDGVKVRQLVQQPFVFNVVRR